MDTGLSVNLFLVQFYETGLRKVQCYRNNPDYSQKTGLWHCGPLRKQWAVLYLVSVGLVLWFHLHANACLFWLMRFLCHGSFSLHRVFCPTKFTIEVFTDPTLLTLLADPTPLQWECIEAPSYSPVWFRFRIRYPKLWSDETHLYLYESVSPSDMFERGGPHYVI